MAKRFAKERWEVEWQELTDTAKARYAADPQAYDHDRDADEVNVAEVFTTQKAALARARVVVDTKEANGQPKTVYGTAVVSHQRLTRVEGTTLWDWENVDEPEYVD